MRRFKRRVLVGGVLAGCTMINLPGAMAQAVPCVKLDQNSFQNYVKHLLISPVLHDYC